VAEAAHGSQEAERSNRKGAGPKYDLQRYLLSSALLPTVPHLPHFYHIPTVYSKFKSIINH
jgi:hypothetical protein